MTFTQMLGLTIGVLALLLSSHVVRSTAARQKRSGVNIDVGFRRVGTFGSLSDFSSDKSPLPMHRFVGTCRCRHPCVRSFSRDRNNGEGRLGRSAP